MNRFRSTPRRPPFSRLLIDHILPGLAAAGLVGFITVATLHLGTVNRSGPDADRAYQTTSADHSTRQPGAPGPDLAIRAGLVSHSAAQGDLP